MADACHNCNRPTCALLTLPKPPYGAEADDWNAADADCLAHTVDWRAETMRLRESCKLLDAEASTAAKAASTRNRDVEVLTAEIARLRDTIAQVRAVMPEGSTFNKRGNAYAALEAVAGILGEVAK